MKVIVRNHKKSHRQWAKSQKMEKEEELRRKRKRKPPSESQAGQAIYATRAQPVEVQKQGQILERRTIHTMFN